MMLAHPELFSCSLSLRIDLRRHVKIFMALSITYNVISADGKWTTQNWYNYKFRLNAIDCYKSHFLVTLLCLFKIE